MKTQQPFDPYDRSTTFVPAGFARIDSVGRSIGSAFVLTIPTEIIILACGNAATPWRAAYSERRPKLYDVAAFIAGRYLELGEHADELTSRLLARQAAAAFGTTDRNADDTWLPPAALARISAFVQCTSPEKLQISRLAEVAGLSVSAFSRAFRGSTGMTPGEFLITSRLERATSLLSSTNLPVAEIARQVGLSSGAHFTEQFRIRRGITPGRFRAKK